MAITQTPSLLHSNLRFEMQIKKSNCHTRQVVCGFHNTKVPLGVTVCAINMFVNLFVSVYRLWEDIHYVGDRQRAGHLCSNTERPVPCH